MGMNDERADRGIAAIHAGTGQPHPWLEAPIVSAIETTLVNVAHACDRFGLPAEEMLADAIRTYQRQLATDGPRVPAVADGDHLTLSEAYENGQIRDGKPKHPEPTV